MKAGKSADDAGQIASSVVFLQASSRHGLQKQPQSRNSKLGKESPAVRELEQNRCPEAVFGEYALQLSREEAYKTWSVTKSVSCYKQDGCTFSRFRQTSKSLELTEKAMQRAADMASVMGIDMQMALDSVQGPQR